MPNLSKKLAQIKLSFDDTFLGRYIIEFQKLDAPDVAAMLAYYLIFSFFPLALAALSLLSLFGLADEILDAVMPLLANSLPNEVADIVLEPLRNFVTSQSASFALIFATVSALWSSTKYLAGFGRANDQIIEQETSGSVMLNRIKMLVFTVIVIIVFAIIAFFLIISGNFIGLIDQYFPALSQIFSLLNSIRIPILLVSLVILLAIIYLVTPSNFSFKTIRQRTFIPGAVLAVLIIAAVTFGLQLYLDISSNFASIYGTIAGLIITLLWFWLINLGILMGAILNHRLELEKRRI